MSLGLADTHEVTRSLGRHVWDDLVEHVKHGLLTFANGQPTHRIAVKADLA